MGIEYRHKDYNSNIEKWQLVENVCDGENVGQYLIQLNPHDNDDENKKRNENYKKRAVFYQVAGYTSRGMNSLLFSKWPLLTVPAALEYVTTNIDGAGVSIYQQAQKVASEVIEKSRAGLFVSYPKTGGASSRADMAALKVFATVHAIEAEQITNWRTTTVGAQVKLSLVVIKETADVIQPDGYDVKCIDQLRELALVDSVFIVRIWQKNDKSKKWEVTDETIPTDGRGNTWDEIPFTFVGAENNSSYVNYPRMYALATVNVAHYRNSADYEDSVWYVGQAQPWMSGVTQMHVDLMAENKMYVGSRAILGVPTGETFSFASAPPNPLVRQAMLDKIEMMIGQGARFITQGGQIKTATESNSDSRTQHSALAMASSNLSEAYTQALAWCARYMNAEGADVEFKTTMDFVIPTATAQDIQAMVAGFVQGAIPMGDYHAWLKRNGIADSEKTLEEFSQEINVATMPNLDQAAV